MQFLRAGRPNRPRLQAPPDHQLTPHHPNKNAREYQVDRIRICGYPVPTSHFCDDVGVLAPAPIPLRAMTHKAGKQSTSRGKTDNGRGRPDSPKGPALTRYVAMGLGLLLIVGT